MPTNYKWNPGHYIMATPNTPIDEILPQIASIPNLLGVQVRLEWKLFEPSFGNFTAEPIIALHDKCNAQAVPAGHPKKRLRILFTYKSFSNSSYAPPSYINSREEAKVDDGAPLYRTNSDGSPDLTRPVFGNYNYGVGWHPKFYNPWIRDRLKALFVALGPQLNALPLLEDIMLNETAFGGAQVPINGLNWNNPDGLQRFRERATAHALALWDIMMTMKASMPNTMVGQYTNFPNTGKFSIIKDPTNPATTPGWPAGTALPPKMGMNGITFGGPDSWVGDTSADNGPFKMYKDYRGVIPLSPSVQNDNYGYPSHASVPESPSSTITIQQLYYKATKHPTDTSVITLYGTHVTWSATDYTQTGHTLTSWREVKDFFTDKWNVGPDAGNRSPGVDTAIPAAIASPVAPAPLKPVLKLEVDSGVSSTDRITNNGTVVVENPAVGGTVQWATKNSGPWSATRPTLVLGANTWYARQFSSGGTLSEVSDPFTFEFCNTIPQLRYITVRDTYAIIGFNHPINLTNAPRPGASAFTFKVNGVVKGTLTGTFVNEDQQRMRVDWTGPLTGGETCTWSYTVPTTDTKFQDVAGNLIAAFTDVPAINLIGLPELTTSCAVTDIATRASGGSTNDTTPLVTGSLSATILSTMDVEVQRQKNDGAFRKVGYATVVGTTWTWQETVGLEDAQYTYRARVQHGDMNSTAGFSPLFVINVDTDAPAAPTVESVVVRTGSAFPLRGTWGNQPGETLSVSVAGVGTFTAGSGLVITGVNWVVNMTPLPVGLYAVGAKVVDAAGNESFSEGEASITVTPSSFGRSALWLRTCGRRPV